MKKFLKVLFIYIPLAFLFVSGISVLFFKWAPVTVTPLMIRRCCTGVEPVSELFHNHWTPLEEISSSIQRTVIASEDGKFMTHNGFDIEEMKIMRENHIKRGKPVRGCSTISQQTAKNCFTWGTRTWARKVFEAYFTILIEAVWGKERILEVYLNVAELGPGIYGVQEAAERYYRKSASNLTLFESATLTCCLPNPLKRTPEWVGRHMSTRRSQILALSRDVILDFDSKKAE